MLEEVHFLKVLLRFYSRHFGPHSYPLVLPIATKESLAKKFLKYITSTFYGFFIFNRVFGLFFVSFLFLRRRIEFTHNSCLLVALGITNWVKTWSPLMFPSDYTYKTFYKYSHCKQINWLGCGASPYLVPPSHCSAGRLRAGQHSGGHAAGKLNAICPGGLVITLQLKAFLVPL